MDNLEKFENNLAFFEDALEKLNQHVYRQQQELIALQEKVKELNTKLASIKISDINQDDEPPPHY